MSSATGSTESVHLRVAELLRQTKIDGVNGIRLSPKADQEVIGLDIAVNEVLRVNVLDPAEYSCRSPVHLSI